MDTQTESAAYTIDQDIPCSQCGYDLRGLTLDGRCPECGSEIGLSIEEWKKRVEVNPLAMSHQSWLRQIAFGFLLLAVGALLGALVYLGEHRYLDREWMLYLACTGWALTHWGVWKLMLSEKRWMPDAEHWPDSWVRVLPVISVLAPGWLYLAPALMYWRKWDVGWLPFVVGVVSLFATLACTYFVIFRIMLCLGRDGFHWTKVVATTQIFLLPLGYAVFLFMVFNELGGPGSVEGIGLLPWPAIGPVLLMSIWPAIHWFIPPNEDTVFILSLTVAQLLVLGLICLTGCLVLRAMRCQKKA